MSLAGLVAYGSSDESSDDEEVITNQDTNKQLSKTTEINAVKCVENKNNKTERNEEILDNSDNVPETNAQIPTIQSVPVAEKSLPNENRSRINLPIPKTLQPEKNINSSLDSQNNGTINFNILPQPKHKEIANSTIEDDDYFPPQKVPLDFIEKPEKKEKGPVKISVPSLSDFKDLDKEKEAKSRIKPSQKGTGLFSVLPPPRSEMLLKSKPMVPHVISKKEIPKKISKPPTKPIEPKKPKSQNSLISHYDSNSDDEDNNSKIDFFSLSTNDDIPMSNIPITDIVQETLKNSKQFSKLETPQPMLIDEESDEIPDKKLVSNVINLPKEEIIQKNKAEVGPKLPVPEQEYNIDSTGNLVFDEKAIEYLCGKRGAKRKNKEFNDVDIIDINGEDIKPDEREWMVKALTEEPVTRPISQGAGPSGQSKKKHQITYLAHQAKAMEVELKNQWAQNKLTRQQTQSKYGF
ncbi:proline-rich protein PRCC [Leptopilina heterotoma]|uniref:proline-rich protein PRCC n=1 Tax=Leptopilina heterotoma TaxID=63436 RepID=UPI001CA8C514|nr:proline-rich protein PRCC [Leptopilina heterotoma]